jgi:predicted dehydrogenase
MTARPLKVGVVGASISDSPDGRERFSVRAHLPALKSMPDRYEVVAACTTRMETATATARRFGLPHAYDNVERMLSELPELDVVCVSVRPSVHHQVVMAALRAGKHVYCEHPLGTTTGQAREIHDLARSKRLRSAVGHQMHYEPAVLQMTEMVRSGYIGKPLAFNITYLASSYIAPRPSHRHWLFNAEMGGHPAYRTGHSLERLTSVLGLDVAEICADMAILVPERPNLDGGAPLTTTQVDNVNFLLRVGPRVMGTLQVCLTAWFGPGWGFQVYGTEGMLMLGVQDRGQKNTIKGDPDSGELKLYGARVDVDHLLAHPTAPELLQRRFQEIPPADKHYYVTGIERGRATFPVAQTWHAFAAAIHSGAAFSPDFRDQLKMHCVWDAAEKSIRDRGWVKVDYSALGEP